MRLTFTVLGAVRAWRDGDELDLGPPQQRAFLGVLLAAGGRPVSLSEIVDALWGADPPDSAINIVQRYVGRLRRIVPVVRAAGGYRIELEDDDLDLLRFRRLVREGRHVEALRLWQGPVGLGLEPEILAAVRQAADAEPAERVLPFVRRAAGSHPLDESLQARLIRVLAAVGRQAEAFEVYQTVRRTLAEELGVDPGAELAEAHAAVLQPAPPLVPAQLPADLLTFTGRRDEIAELLSRPSGILTIGGMAGIGKTTLAVHIAHQLAGRFPDGQLYVNLRGFDATGAVTRPEEALRGFLDALGAPPAHRPSGVDGLSALYRSHMAGRRMLLLLDNARDAEHVTPLLARRVGADRVAAEPDAVDEIVARCGRLPLALATVAARAATNRGFALRTIAAELARAQGSLRDGGGNRCAGGVLVVLCGAQRGRGSRVPLARPASRSVRCGR